MPPWIQGIMCYICMRHKCYYGAWDAAMFINPYIGEQRGNIGPECKSHDYAASGPHASDGESNGTDSGGMLRVGMSV
jgi:hypothetical protein